MDEFAVGFFDDEAGKSRSASAKASGAAGEFAENSGADFSFWHVDIILREGDFRGGVKVFCGL